MVRALSRMAITVSPGMPRVSMGIMAPPVTALLAASAARMPSMEPLPYSSGCLEARLLSL